MGWDAVSDEIHTERTSVISLFNSENQNSQTSLMFLKNLLKTFLVTECKF